MVVVVLRARPEGEPVVGRPREVVARVGLDSLEEAEGHPDESGGQVEVVGEVAPDQRTANGAGTQDQDFNGVGVLGSETERRRPLMVKLVDVLVEGAVVETAVSPVVEEVFKDEKEDNLGDHLGQRRKGDGRNGHAKVDGDGVETNNHGQLKEEVGKKNIAEHPPLVGRSVLNGLLLDLVLLQ